MIKRESGRSVTALFNKYYAHNNNTWNIFLTDYSNTLGKVIAKEYDLPPRQGEAYLSSMPF